MKPSAAARDQLLPPVCILAGGKATRLGAVAREMPKALVPVAGEPFISHQLRLLAANGGSDVVLCVGHLGEQIEAFVGATRFGLRIRYSYDSPALDGTLGAIRRAAGLLGERFLVLHGDTYLRIDYRSIVQAWSTSGFPAVMTVLRNEDRWDQSNAVFADGLVSVYSKTARTSAMHWIDYGLGGLTAGVIERFATDASDLALLYAELARAGLLQGIEVSERFYEIGTPEALAEADTFLRQLRHFKGEFAAPWGGS